MLHIYGKTEALHHCGNYCTLQKPGSTIGHRLCALSAHIAHCLYCAHLHISHCKDQPRSGSCTAPVYCTNHAPPFRAPVQAYIAQIMIHLSVCLVLADFAYWRLHIAHITAITASHFCKLQCTFEKALICSIHTILYRHRTTTTTAKWTIAMSPLHHVYSVHHVQLCTLMYQNM